ncbi:hypothetical protein AX767_00655 [Variovorax sp. PAMC 28711]|nr:hypothetical protein AX767_00655 [Variovorax sp. PAMC 28711]
MAVEGKQNEMADTTPPQFESRADEQLYTLTTHTLQLLTMMEVVHVSMAQDATYLADATAALEAYSGVTRNTGMPVALDPGGRSRDSLQQIIDKSQVLYRSSLHMTKNSATDLSSVHGLIARSLNRLVSICQRLLEALNRHEQPFEQGNGASRQASA